MIMLHHQQAKVTPQQLFVEHHVSFKVINFSKVDQLWAEESSEDTSDILVFKVILFSGC